VSFSYICTRVLRRDSTFKARPKKKTNLPLYTAWQQRPKRDKKVKHDLNKTSKKEKADSQKTALSNPHGDSKKTIAENLCTSVQWIVK